MKNNILKLLFLFLIISCSKDDASKDTLPEEPKILPKKFQLLAQTQYGEFITAYECSFSYNEKKQINKLDISSPIGNENIKFTYGNHGLPTQMDVVTLQGSKQFNFDYGIHWYEIAIVMGWTALFIFLSYLLLKKRDL